MRHVDTRVDDSNDCAFTLLGHLIGSHHELGAQVCGILPLRSRSLRAALGIDGGSVVHVPFTLQERRLNAVRAADRVQSAGGCLQGEAVKSLAVLTLHTRGGSGQRPGHGLVDRSEGARPIGPVLQLDDDADQARRILAAHRHVSIGRSSLAIL